MTQEQAELFMTKNIVMLSDDDGAHFGVCVVEDGDCTVESPDKLMAHTMADDAGAEVVTVAELATAAGWSAP